MEATEEGLDDTSLLSRLSAPPPAPVPAKEKVDQAAKEIAAQGDQTLVDWFKTFSGSSLKISLHRQAPEVWEGRQVAGHLGSFDELIDEDQIAERFGGGKYQIKAQKQLANGRWNFAGAKTFKIAGDPKITAEHFPSKDEKVIPLAPVAPAADAEVTKVAMTSMERMSLRAMERAEKIEDQARGQSPFDPNILALVTKPLESQITSLNAQLLAKDNLLAEKDRIIKDLTERRPDTTLQDTLLTKMYDGESAKLNNLRMQHDAERRIMLENQAEEKKRMEHRSDIERQNLIESHKRELKQMEMSYEHQLKASELSHRGLLDAKENRCKDLERQITRLDAEVAELRAKKDKTLIEQARELATVQETLKAMGLGGSDDDEEESTAERIMNGLADNPIVKGIGARLQMAPETPPQPRPAPPRPPQQLRPRVRKAGETTASPPAPPPAPTGLPPGVTQEGLRTAVQLLEGAVTNGTEPEVFAASVRNMVPDALIAYIKAHGIDSLLDGAARLTEASPLSTQVGRMYARRAAKALAAS